MVRALKLRISPDDCSYLIANRFLLGCCQWELLHLPEQSAREREACGKPSVSVGNFTRVNDIYMLCDAHLIFWESGNRAFNFPSCFAACNAMEWLGSWQLVILARVTCFLDGPLKAIALFARSFTATVLLRKAHGSRGLFTM